MTEKLTLSIEGMHCGGCSTGIQMVTSALDGVESAFIDLDAKKGDFEIDSSEVSKEKIIEEIGKLGYKAS